MSKNLFNKKSKQRTLTILIILAIITIVFSGVSLPKVISEKTNMAGYNPNNDVNPELVSSIELPAITGNITDALSAQKIEKAVAEEQELEASTTIPDFTFSTNWPPLEPSVDGPSYSETNPAFNSDGKLYISSEVISTSVNQANNAFLTVVTPEFKDSLGFDSTIIGGFDTENREGFQTIGAGSRLIAFHIDSQSIDKAIITTRVERWENDLYGTKSNITKHQIINQAIIKFSLVTDTSGNWLVGSALNFQFVPGEGP